MPSGQLDDVVRHLRQMAGFSDCQRLTDSQLLEQYISSHDENAFAALVYRYGRLVRSVCRHFLHQEEDIDDAFQVTFMIFASKAASIRRASSVASWLYGVAYRTAMNAKRNRARRCEKQRNPGGHSREQPVTEAALREVQAILDQEVQRLPEKYRAPFILCCLEGKSRAECAQQLGLKEGTVSSRLAQARKQLQQRLARRGVVLSAALCAVELSRTTVAASVSTTLVKGLIEGGLACAAGRVIETNLISAEAAALAKGALQAMSAKTLKAALSALLTIGFVTGAGLLTCHVLAKKPAADRQSISPAKGAAKNRTEAPAGSKQDNIEVTIIRGFVLDPNGKPLADAKLYLAKPASLHRLPYPALSQKATSGPDGHFRFAVPKAELECNTQEESPAQVMVVADGYGCDWATIDPEQRDLTLRLVKDVPLGLRILDLNGRPVTGAKITVTDLWNPKDGDLGSYLDALRKNGQRTDDKHWHGPPPEKATATTGRDGRFHLAGVGRDRIVKLRIEGPAIATASLNAMTRVSPVVTNPKETWAFVGQEEIYGATSDYIATVSRPIRGVVRDKETGKPLADVWVGDEPWAKTDEKGRYELNGLAKAARYRLLAEPADGLHFQRGVELQDTPGLDALTCDIELVRWLMVRGRVMYKETGKPIVGARVQYWPLGGNPYLNKLLPGSWRPHSKAMTGPDGSYALTVMPGPGAITVIAPKLYKYMPAAVTLKERKDFFKTPLDYGDEEDGLTTAVGGGGYGGIYLSRHNAVVLVEPGEKEKTLVRDVVLQKPLERNGRVIGPDGRPIKGVRFYSMRPQRIAETLKGAEFTVRGINPKAPRSLVFYHKDKKLGYHLRDLRNDPSEPLTIMLQPCGSASGRILDPDGKPVAGLRGHLYRVEYNGRRSITDGAAEEGGAQPVITDKDGRFRVEGLVPGQMYEVIKWSDRRPGFLYRFALVRVKPGEHKELGDLKMDRIE